jgi:hypothetical protein
MGMNMRKTLWVIMPLLLVSPAVFCPGNHTNNLRKVAIEYAVAREWHEGQIYARAVRARGFTFDFKTKVSMGGNLMGITGYVDEGGAVITKSEDMLHVD